MTPDSATKRNAADGRRSVQRVKQTWPSSTGAFVAEWTAERPFEVRIVEARSDRVYCIVELPSFDGDPVFSPHDRFVALRHVSTWGVYEIEKGERLRRPVARQPGRRFPRPDFAALKPAL